MTADWITAMMTNAAVFLLAWLATYAIHSTVLLGLGWVATTRRGPVRAPGSRDNLWKLVVVGAFVTSTAQLLTHGAGMAGTIRMPWGPHAVVSAPAPSWAPAPKSPTPDVGGTGSTASLTPASLTFSGASAAVAPPAAPSSASSGEQAFAETGFLPQSQFGRARLLSSLVPRSQPGGPPLPASPAAVASPSRGSSWPVFAALLWLVPATAFLFRQRYIRKKMYFRIGKRHAVCGSHLHTALDQMRRSAGIKHPVRLSFSARLSGPVALPNREICLPIRSLTELNADQLETLLAHELAHLARRDPAWLSFCGVLEALFFFQPLNRLARRRLQEAWEFLCDDWAVEKTGQSFALATCLSHVADWVQESAHAHSPALGMAADPSSLVQRVQRLLGSGQSRGHRLSPFAVLGFGAALWASVGILAPGVVAEAPRSPGSPQAPRHAATLVSQVPTTVGRIAPSSDEATKPQSAASPTINTQVPTDASSSTRTSRWQIEIQEFSDPQTADQMVRSLHENGLVVSSRQVGGRYFVMCGPVIANPGVAQRLAEELIKNGYFSAHPIDLTRFPNAANPESGGGPAIQHKRSASLDLLRRSHEGTLTLGRMHHLEPHLPVYNVTEPLRPGDSVRLGDAVAQLAAVETNNPDDPNDDSAVIVVRTSDSDHKLTLREFQSRAINDRLTLIVDDVTPDSTHAQGRAVITLRLQSEIPPAPQVTRRLRPGDVVTLGDSGVRVLSIVPTPGAGGSEAHVGLLLRDDTSTASLTLDRYRSSTLGALRVVVEDAAAGPSSLPGGTTSTSSPWTRLTIARTAAHEPDTMNSQLRMSNYQKLIDKIQTGIVNHEEQSANNK